VVGEDIVLVGGCGREGVVVVGEVTGGLVLLRVDWRW
jgi:hypothetical protein